MEPEDRGKIKKKFEKVLQGKTEAPYELSYKTADGRIITVEINMNAIYDGERIVGVQGISRDLTERKLAEETARKDEERFRKMVQNSMDALSFLSRGDLLVYVRGR